MMSTGFSITNACENPELLIQWVDTFYDTYWSMQCDLGPVGINLIDKGDGTYSYVVGGKPTPISEKTFIRMWQRIERTIDLHGATPHVFRHTYMTFAQRAQIPVKTLQAIGGYADLATLQDRYVHTQNEDIEAARGAWTVPKKIDNRKKTPPVVE